jgi:Protein of unknown function (DUF3570)
MRRLRSLSALAFIVCALSASLAGADAASGTYTGSLNARGNYYWERSTRVVAPEVNAIISAPVGVRVEGSYLLDAITSASTATGVTADKAFTEKRNEGLAGLGYEVDFGKAQLDVAARGRISREPDYHSLSGGFSAALSLDQRNTVLKFNGFFTHDDVFRVERSLPAVNPGKLIASKALPVGELEVVYLGVAVDQVFNRTVTLTLGYDLSLMNGFQANAYRMVKFQDGSGGAPEKHPDQRTRHAPYLWFAKFFETTRSALRVGYRFYDDDWDIQAHAVDTRVHQELGDNFELRLRYRYYTQQASFFHREGGNLHTDQYVTDDPKMTAFHNHTLGLKMRLALGFLSFTKFDPLRTLVLDWGVEYVLNTNRYGNGVIAQGGLGWVF